MSLASGRVRRALASVLTLVFLALYVWAAIEIGMHIPDNPWIELLYYGLAGTLWGVPLIPLYIWAGRGR